VFDDHFGGVAFPVSPVTAPAKIAQLVAFIDSLPIGQPGATACPELGPATTLYDLRFLPASGAPPLARAVQDGCGGLAFSIRGRSAPGLAQDEDLAGLLWKLGALPACTGAQLRGSATLPTRVPSPAALVAQLSFRDVSGSACSLNGFARLRLLGATGLPLPTQVTNSNFPASAVTLTPGMSAGISLQWAPPGVSCTGARAAFAKVTLPHVSPPFLVPLGSHRRPFAPCRGRIRADAIG
jgi:hypothetical protein